MSGSSNSYMSDMAASTSPLTAPPAAVAMQRFLEAEDLSLLEKPLLFEADQGQFKKLLCCQGATACLLTCGTVAPCMPIGMCCPYKLAPEFSLRLDQDNLQFTSASNDCCCHIAKTLKTVPLEKVQDVELQSNCLLTCFGLKAVNVQTAGQGGSPMPEVSAPFLAAPEKVREAIQLAVKLYRQRALPAAGCGGAYRAPIAAWSEGQAGGGWPGAQQAGAGSLRERLHRLEALVTRGVLSCQEADELKVSVLAAAEESWLCRLGEAADLRDSGLISDGEFGALRASLMRQLAASGASA